MKHLSFLLLATLLGCSAATDEEESANDEASLAAPAALGFATQGNVFDVTKYGAPSNGTGDATKGVAAAISASKCGDTILFPKGTFHFASAVSWPGCRKYMSLANASATLTGAGPQGTLVNFHDAQKVVVQGLTFKGGGIFLERTGGTSIDNVIDNNVFSVNPGCTSGNCNQNGIYFTTTLENSKITNNLFTDFQVVFGYGIIGYCYRGSLVANNEFIGIPSGMHVDARGPSGYCGNTVFEQNFFSKIGRNPALGQFTKIGPGMELQSSPTNLVLQDNWFEHPSLSSTFGDNDYSYAFSVPLGGSTGSAIRRNVVIAPERPDGKGCRIGFEVGGISTTVEQNYVNGINAAIADTDGYGTAALPHRVNAHDNFIANALEGVTGRGGYNVLLQSNNGPNTKLSWSLSRGRPYRNKRY